jgi:branched-chain amino acid transport system permease protein
MVTERVIIRPVYGAHLKQILVTVGVLIVAEQVVPVIWGGVPVPVPRPAMFKGSFLLGDVAIERYRLMALATGLAVYGGLVAVLTRTRIGLLIRAGVQNREMVEALGYRIRTVFVGVFIAGSALAGLGGAMWGMYNELITAALGGEVLILAFIVIIIGGPGSTSGAFHASLLVGLTANYVGYLAPKLALGSNILLMLAILMWRPTGLLPASRN